MFNMESIKLGNMSTDSVNSLVSETLHVTPRITRPLSDVLYQKSRGNPLFLRQLMGSLCRQGYIYVELSQPRWSWDLNMIDTASYFIICASPVDERNATIASKSPAWIRVASCFGSHVGKDVLSILSQGLGVDLVGILEQVCQMGFMYRENNGVMFRFAHDKIQQAGM